MSLRSRLSWSASVVVAFWVLLVALAANLVLASSLSGQADGVLRARAEAVASTLEISTAGVVTVDEGAGDQALDVGTWILDPGGRIVEGPPGATRELGAAAVGSSGRGRRGTTVTGNDPVRLFALPVTRGGVHRATVVTSTSLAPYRQLTRVARWGSGLAAVVLLVVVHLVLRANVGRALRPVQEMSAQAARWSADDVERRFGPPPRPAELAELAATLDGVLDRLSAVLRHERRLTDELSHELRTPLSRLRGEVDLARGSQEVPGATVTALGAIDAAAGEMQQIIETLLSAGRLGASAAPGRCSVAVVVAGVTSSVAGRAGLRVGTSVESELVAGVDAAVLARLITPVVDNAVRYARSQVAVRASREGGALVLVIDDDGPGTGESDAERVFEPGWRAARDDGHAGGGLGLALARRLATACGGSIACRSRAGGGRFEITLPPG